MTSNPPAGWCPVHLFDDLVRCGSWCARQRQEYIRVARELEDYWRSADRHLYERELAARVARERLEREVAVA